MRLAARIGAALTVAAALITGTTGVAAAASSGFAVYVKHSSGVVAASVSGKLAWSTSHRTVTVTDLYLWTKINECSKFTIRGYQGSTPVTDPVEYGDCGTATENGEWWIEDQYLTTATAGGIDHVIIRFYDVWHEISSYANCYVTASTCQYG